MNDCIHEKQWDVIVHPCSNCNDGLVNRLSNWGLNFLSMSKYQLTYPTKRSARYDTRTLNFSVKQISALHDVIMISTISIEQFWEEHL